MRSLCKWNNTSHMKKKKRVDSNLGKITNIQVYLQYQEQRLNGENTACYADPANKDNIRAVNSTEPTYQREDAPPFQPLHTQSSDILLAAAKGRRTKKANLLLESEGTKMSECFCYI